MAKKISAMTSEQLDECNNFNREIVEEFLEMKSELSPNTIPQYKSALNIWIRWIKDYANNQPIYEIKSRDYAKYQNWLSKQGLGESAIRFKRSTVSSLNEYIIIYYEEEYPTFRNFVNTQIKVPLTGEIYDKQPLTPEEYELLCDKLAEMGEWQKLAYIKFSYSTGCRREECRQVEKSILDAEPNVKTKEIKLDDGTTQTIDLRFYKTHKVRCKGRGEVGNQRRLIFSQDAYDAIAKWIEVRGSDNCEYVFVTKSKDSYEQIGIGGFNYWCNTLFSEIVGRRVHPHLFRETRATHLVVNEGKDIDVAKKLLGHKSIETTRIYVITDDEDDADDAFEL